MTPPPAGAPAPDEPIDDAQLSPRAWVARNGPTLILVLAALVALYFKMGLEGTWTIAKVAIGLGAVIFIHELGHFLVAKWCDVHVQTFSIGFGPALPGCIFKWGETTYKIALFPLGGYVKMIGEGGENDEEDTDPRSYKNKTVGQRMAIISAGVVMNVIFGLVVFIAAFKIGAHQTAPVVGVLEAGGPAWQKGVRPGDRFVKVGGTARPYFEDLKVAVMLSNQDEQIPFEFEAPGQQPRQLLIVPRKTRAEKRPVIGINPPMELRLPRKGDVEDEGEPVLRDSAAAAARVLNLGPDDQLVAATDPSAADADKLTDLPAGPKGYAELGERLLRLAGKPAQVTVRRAGGDRVETIPLEPGFHFEDAIVGTTDPAADNPFRTAPLEKDPRDPEGRHLDYFQFLGRLGDLAGKPVVIQVRRKGAAAGAEPDSVFVPPAYHRVIPGVRMEMGAVTALRDGSGADTRGVKEHDVITGVKLTDGRGESVTFLAAPNDEGEKQLDPLRLPFDLRSWARGRPDVKATLRVRRVKDRDADATEEIAGLHWDDAERDEEALPIGVTASLALGELGIAYQVKSQVAAVAPGSAAAKAGVQAEDFVLGWNYQRPPKKGSQEKRWLDKPINLRSDDSPQGDPEPRWASMFYNLQVIDYPQVKLQVRHKNGEEATVDLDLQIDEGWPLFEPSYPRGVLLGDRQDRIVYADGLGEAVQMGMRYTWRTIVTIYMSLKALLTNRVSAVDNLQGPIDIARISYQVASGDWADFLLLLGLISVNLAVVNFLPIPVLDGGHMVFLIYEKLRGRPASEHVRSTANIFGLIVLASLMIFVIGLGVWRIWPLITG